MNWNSNFYKEYAEHLTEPVVRETHDKMFGILNNLYKSPKLVVDYGCGTGEYDNYDRFHDAYFGIDKNQINKKLPHRIGDFINDEIVLPFEPTVFVSVFASEIILSPEDKYSFYRNVFNKYPTIKIGMVAGAFYKGKENNETAQEEGGFTIFQTIEPQQQWLSAEFTEIRCYCEVPSVMWGDVVEVWKFFLRN